MLKTGFIPTDSTAMNFEFLIALNKTSKYIFSTSEIQYSICGLHSIVQNHSNKTGQGVRKVYVTYLEPYLFSSSKGQI